MKKGGVFMAGIEIEQMGEKSHSRVCVNGIPAKQGIHCHEGSLIGILYGRQKEDGCVPVTLVGWLKGPLWVRALVKGTLGEGHIEEERRRISLYGFLKPEVVSSRS